MEKGSSLLLGTESDFSLKNEIVAFLFPLEAIETEVINSRNLLTCLVRYWCFWGSKKIPEGNSVFCNNLFPPIGTEVSPYTVAGDLIYKNIEEKKPAKVDALEWFPDNFQLLSQTKKQFLWEQCFRVSDAGILTCIWCN